MSSVKKRILVIGAGVSGLTAIKACKEEGLDVTCYERGGEWGGLWRYRDESAAEGVPSVMKSTVSNTSKEMSSFSDYPSPGEYPSYMHHDLVIKYLESYAEHFDLLGCVSYYQEVVELIPAADYGSTGEWLVKVRRAGEEVREETFDGVMACTGHHSYPFTPSYPNMDLFSGRILHSHGYKTFAGLEDKVVVVVGAGNSGADIAVEAATVAKKVYLSTRRGAWIYPRLFDKGKPMDTCLTRRSKSLLPASLFAKQLRRALNARMDHERFGVRPFHSVLSQHPTINDDLQPRLLNGSVVARGDLKDFSSNGVVFDGEDGRFTPVDVVVFATGFVVKFPFLSDDILRVGKNNKVFLYKNVFPPQLKHHTLAVIGLVQPSGSLFPVFEMQSRWFAALMCGRCRLPSTDTMLADVRKTEGVRTRSYVQSPRHSVEVPWMQYMDDLSSQFGAKPNMAALLATDPKLFWACFFGPCLPYQYRLAGPYRWEGAREAILTYKKRLFEHLARKDK